MLSLDHAWVEEEGERNVREGGVGDKAQSQVEVVKQVTGSPNNVPHPAEQGISRGLTKESLCKKGGVGKTDCK